MRDATAEIQGPDRILKGICGLNQKCSLAGWDGLYFGLIEELIWAQRRMVAAMADAD